MATDGRADVNRDAARWDLKVALIVGGLFFVGSISHLILRMVFPSMSRDLSLTYSALFSMNATMSLTGLISVMAWGALSNRMNPTRIVYYGAAATVIGAAPIVSGASFGFSLAGAVIWGAGMACLPFIGFVLFCKRVHIEVLGRSFLIPALLGATGGIFAPVTVAYLSDLLGWRPAVGIAVGTLAALAGVLAWFVNRVAEPASRPSLGHERESTDRQRLRRIQACSFSVLIAVQLVTGLLAISSYALLGPLSGIPDADPRLISREVRFLGTFIMSCAAVGFVTGAPILDFVGRPVFWVGRTLSVGVVGVIALLAFDRVPLIVSTSVLGILAFACSAATIPLLRLIVGRLDPKVPGFGLAFLFVAAGVGSYTVFAQFWAYVAWPNGQWIIPTVVVIASIAAALAFVISRDVDMKLKTTAGNS